MVAGIRTVAIAALLSFSWLGSAQAASIYLDFGVEGAPSSDFGAASGQPGVWNDIGAPFNTTLDTFVVDSTIVDTSGAATAVSVEVTASNMFGRSGGDPSDDPTHLVNDNLTADPGFGPWSLSISGLGSDFYDVYIYDPVHGGVGTGAGSVNGVSFGEINGGFDGAFTEGSNYHLLTSVPVVAGLLTASAGAVDLSHSGVAGLQLVSVTPTPVPLPIALPLFAAGLGFMGLLGWCRRRSYSVERCS